MALYVTVHAGVQMAHEVLDLCSFACWSATLDRRL